MEKDTIISRSQELPRVERDKPKLEDAEVWRDEENGTKFMLIRRNISEHKEQYALKLSGDLMDISNIVDDFRQVFGNPDDIRRLPEVEQPIVVTWMVDKAENLEE